ncbi:MAG: type II toxin-antitoxin system RelE/ParE family toxin [Verrucomicrobiaceae bacterium]|nr:type II toxin-antitoxin system RelE/ParE family toxin [Verrucomicrobiaceae bacterium]
MNVILSDGAKRDFNEGLQWYRKQSDQAADNFIKRTLETAQRIAADPTRYRQILPEIRILRYKKYPYSLIYRILPDVIKVYAVAHDKRRPGYWKRRLS